MERHWQRSPRGSFFRKHRSALFSTSCSQICSLWQDLWNLMKMQPFPGNVFSWFFSSWYWGYIAFLLGFFFFPLFWQNSKFSEVYKEKHFNTVMRFYPLRILEEKKRKVLSILINAKDSNDLFSTFDITFESWDKNIISPNILKIWSEKIENLFVILIMGRWQGTEHHSKSQKRLWGRTSLLHHTSLKTTCPSWYKIQGQEMKVEE